MKFFYIKCLLLLLPFSLFGDSPFVDDSDFNNNNNNNSNSLLPKMDYSIDLKQIQKKLLKSRNPNSILNIKYENNRSYRIRTRQNVKTLFIFDEEPIAYSFIGNEKAFEKKELKIEKYDFSNMLVIKPNLIGVDTNLTVIGESGNIYVFHIYSTDYKNKQVPDTLVFISSSHDKIYKINIVNVEKEDFLKKEKKKLEELKKLKDKIEKASKKEKDKFLIIGQGSSSIKILKSKIINDFVQDGDADLKSFKIFRDQKFTYFKYDASNALKKFPNVYVVQDGYDSPTNTRVVGNYLIAETVSDKFTLRLGEKYVCVRRTKEINNEK